MKYLDSKFTKEDMDKAQVTGSCMCCGSDTEPVHYEYEWDEVDGFNVPIMLLEVEYDVLCFGCSDALHEIQEPENTNDDELPF